MSLPELICSPLSDGVTPDVLPEGVHDASLVELADHFVEHPSVPYRKDRERLFTVLGLYLAQVWEVWPKAEVWINGGFVTHKKWAPPSDVDVAIVDTFGRIEKYRQQAVSLLTLQGVLSSSLSAPAPRVQPYGGMIDGFAVGRTPANLALWDDTWSTLLDENRTVVPGVRKGYVRVVSL